MEGLQVEIAQVKRKLNAVKFILGIGGEENDLVPNFRKWSESRLQDYLEELQGTYKELQAKENILLTQNQQQKAGNGMNTI